MARDLRVFNRQRLQTNQLAASVPVQNPGAVRPLHALSIAKKGVMTKPGQAVAQPVTNRFANTFNAQTNNNSRIGQGYVIQYPLARMVPAMRARMQGNQGHPVITKIGGILSRSK